MRAVFFEEKGRAVCREVPVPEVLPNEVLIQVVCCGICGSDSHIFKGELPLQPCIIGHEFSGIITQIGAEVTRFQVGARVTVRPVRLVGGEEKLIGCAPEADGAMADFIAVQERYVYALPDSISFEDAALLEPACVAAHGVLDFAQLAGGETVVVLGAGPIGIMAGILAKSCGATVILIGRSTSEARLAVGKRLGADVTLQTDRDNVIAEVMTRTRGKGADVVFECAGSNETVSQSLILLKKGGKMVELAITPMQGTTFNTYLLAIMNELSLQGSFCTASDNWPRVIELLSTKAISFAGMVTHHFGLEDCQKAFETKGIKVLLHP